MFGLPCESKRTQMSHTKYLGRLFCIILSVASINLLFCPIGVRNVSLIFPSDYFVFFLHVPLSISLSVHLFLVMAPIYLSWYTSLSLVITFLIIPLSLSLFIFFLTFPSLHLSTYIFFYRSFLLFLASLYLSFFILSRSFSIFSEFILFNSL